MAQGKRDRLSKEQRIDMWRRWKAGESLHEIGRAFGKGHGSIRFLLKREHARAPRNHLPSLFIQARGVLKKELVQHLRSKRLIRRSRHSRADGQSRGQIVHAEPKPTLK